MNKCGRFNKSQEEFLLVDGLSIGHQIQSRRYNTYNYYPLEAEEHKTSAFE